MTHIRRPLPPPGGRSRRTPATASRGPCGRRISTRNTGISPRLIAFLDASRLAAVSLGCGRDSDVARPWEDLRLRFDHRFESPTGLAIPDDDRPEGQPSSFDDRYIRAVADETGRVSTSFDGGATSSSADASQRSHRSLELAARAWSGVVGRHALVARLDAFRQAVRRELGLIADVRARIVSLLLVLDAVVGPRLGHAAAVAILTAKAASSSDERLGAGLLAPWRSRRRGPQLGVLGRTGDLEHPAGRVHLLALDVEEDRVRLVVVAVGALAGGRLERPSISSLRPSATSSTLPVAPCGLPSFSAAPGTPVLGQAVLIARLALRLGCFVDRVVSASTMQRCTAIASSNSWVMNSSPTLASPIARSPLVPGRDLLPPVVGQASRRAGHTHGDSKSKFGFRSVASWRMVPDSAADGGVRSPWRLDARPTRQRPTRASRRHGRPPSRKAEA